MSAHPPVGGSKGDLWDFSISSSFLNLTKVSVRHGTELLYGLAGRARPPAWKNPGLAALALWPVHPRPSAGACAAPIPLGSHLLRHKPLDFRPMLPPQPLQVQHTRSRLALVPRRVEPPTVPLRLLQSKLLQAQQRQR